MEINVTIIVALLALVGAPLTAFVTWQLNKRKSETDISAAIIHASGDAVDAIKVVMDALQVELKETRADLIEFKKQNEELEVSLNNLKIQNEGLMKENQKLAIEIEQLRQQINRLSSVESAPHDS